MASTNKIHETEGLMKTVSKFGRTLEVMGFGLVKILLPNFTKGFNVVFQKGIDIPMIQNILELFKQEFKSDDHKISFIPLDNFTIYVNYFENSEGEKLIAIYMFDKGDTGDYSRLYLHARKIRSLFRANSSLSKIRDFCEETIIVPRIGGVKAIYILSKTGIPFFSRTLVNEVDEPLIAGFISAIFSMSEQIIGKDTGAKLKEINFGNHIFYTVVKKEIIFVYLVCKLTPLLKRYMYYVADLFIEKFKEEIENFFGDVAVFDSFDDILEQYFKI
ncbi:MAG: hypothetical protein ACTSRW_16160 [Candidatus Helarchaeota archaeon]